MPITIPIDDKLERRLDELRAHLAEGDEVILEDGGRPRAVVVSADVYDELLLVRGEAAKRRAVERRFAARRAELAREHGIEE